MSKELVDMTFEELVKRGVEMDLDAIVTGERLAKRIWTLLHLGVQWHQYTSEARKKLADAAAKPETITALSAEAKMILKLSGRCQVVIECEGVTSAKGAFAASILEDIKEGIAQLI